MSTPIEAVLQEWLLARLQPPEAAWLTDRLAVVASGNKQAFFLAFGLVARKLGKADLALTDAELARAEQVRPGWDPRGWSIDQAARTLLVLTYPTAGPAECVAVLDQLFAAGEMHELVALYQALPLYPHPAAHALRCAEGQRSNIRAVFSAIAHRNPYPSEQLNEDQWNQLILKCLFVDLPLDPVVGLDRRANATLARILVDFAHERWAAKRPVSPELWRCVGPFADEAMVRDLQCVLASADERQRMAAALALQACPHPAALAALQAANIVLSGWNWHRIAQPEA
jgi:hypothetical protein